MAPADARFEYLLRLADDRLVLGHRLSEWCGHAPVLEEELALANVALDLIGQATHLLETAAECEGHGRSADDLAFFREAIDYRNALLVEQPNGDFAHTVVRQFLFDAYDVELLAGLERSTDPALAAWAAKARKESAYHLRHSRTWLVRLGDGTEESTRRTVAAVGELWRFTAELFEADDVEHALVEARVAVDPASLRRPWLETVGGAFEEARLDVPEAPPWKMGRGRTGRHSEHLGHLLSEMQIVARSHPGARW